MIYLVRHGFIDNKFNNKDNVMKVIEIKNYIIDNNIKIEKIYSSYIECAKETADIINSGLRKKIIYDKRLRGLNNKVFNNDSYITNNTFNSIDKKNIEGESIRDLYNRISLFLDNFNEEDVLIVTHNRFINMVYYILNDIKLDIEKDRYNIDICSMYEVDIKLKKIRIIFN